MKATVPLGLPGLETRGRMNSGIPTKMGSTRHQPGGGGVVLWLTPTGVIHTRRRETSELRAASRGTITTMARYWRGSLPDSRNCFQLSRIHHG
jgi:hypothetical protein